MIINTRIDASKLRTQHIADVSRIFTLASCLPLASRELAAQLMEDPDLSADAAPAADADDESLFSKQGTGQLRVLGAKKRYTTCSLATACLLLTLALTGTGRNFKVIVRVRPPVASEQEAYQPCVRIDGKASISLSKVCRQHRKEAYCSVLFSHPRHPPAHQSAHRPHFKGSTHLLMIEYSAPNRFKLMCTSPLSGPSCCHPLKDTTALS